MTLDYPKGGVLKRRKPIIKHTIFGKSKGSCRYFVVETKFFVLDIPNILFVVLIFFNKTWNSTIILMQFVK